MIRNEEKWKKRISEALKRFGYDGEVTIDPEPDSDELTIWHSDFVSPFTGIFSKDGTFLTVVTMERYTQDPEDDFERFHCEAFVFDTVTFEPLYYSIYSEPENQKIMMSDFGRYKRGEILYQNNCIHGRYIERVLDKPLFASEIVDINHIIS